MATLYLIGDPVAHSLSPAMQNAAFAALSLPHRYELMRVAAAYLPDALRRVREVDVLGANVTIPHKEAIARHLDRVEEGARRIGAVNTLFKRAGALRGDNTDAPGFGDALAESGIEVRARRVLLLGAGGAARACADHLIGTGASLWVSARTPERAARIAGAEVVPWPVASLAGYDVVVNATSLGLHGEDPLEGLDLVASIAVADVVATAEETALVRRARAAGCRTMDGLAMLLHQGVRAFKLWTGLDAPAAVMRAALPRAVPA